MKPRDESPEIYFRPEADAILRPLQKKISKLCILNLSWGLERKPHLARGVTIQLQWLHDKALEALISAAENRSRRAGSPSKELLGESSRKCD